MMQFDHTNRQSSNYRNFLWDSISIYTNPIDILKRNANIIRFVLLFAGLEIISNILLIILIPDVYMDPNFNIEVNLDESIAFNVDFVYLGIEILRTLSYRLILSNMIVLFILDSLVNLKEHPSDEEYKKISVKETFQQGIHFIPFLTILILFGIIFIGTFSLAISWILFISSTDGIIVFIFYMIATIIIYISVIIFLTIWWIIRLLDTQSTWKSSFSKALKFVRKQKFSLFRTVAHCWGISVIFGIFFWLFSGVGNLIFNESWMIFEENPISSLIRLSFAIGLEFYNLFLIADVYLNERPVE